jgi:DNA-binding SARP family transcriptional activator
VDACRSRPLRDDTDESRLIYLQTLGEIEVRVDGEPAPRQLTWRKNLALLLYLARSSGCQRSREHLIGLLWGDKPESSARHSLNEALRVIRRSAGDDVIEADSTRIKLAADTVTLDVDRLEERMADEDWEGAADLVGGVYMEGFAVPNSSGLEDWLAAERSLWLRHSVDVLVRCAESALLSGDLDLALAAADRATALDPLSNVAVRASMRTAALRGERAKALGEYDRFADFLEQSLGVAPDAETVRLADRVRRERTWRLPPALTEKPDRSRRAPLVGRDRQLQLALDAWHGAAAASRSAALIVQGDPGAGKTRLVEEILARTRLEGAVVAGIRAVAADHEMPWSGLLGLARGGLVEAPGLTAAPLPSLAAFGARLSRWREAFGAETEDVEPAPLARAFSDVARAVSEEQPLVLVVDDAEWLDDESALALIGTLRDLEALPCSVILASPRHRLSDHFDELRSHLGREIAGRVIEVGVVTGIDIAALARHILPDYADDEIERIARRVEVDSAGLPLIVVELLSAVRLGLELGETSGGWPERNKTLDQTLPSELPDSVVGSIRIGFRRLSPEAQQVLTAVSVLDERVSSETIEAATGLSGETLIRALDELEWERWLVAEPRGYGFLARITGEVIAEDMLTAGQRRRIRAAAEGGG